MADNTVDFRLRLIDDLSKQMKKTRKLTESSLKSMSKEQVKLNSEIAKQEDKVVKLQNSLHKASTARKKDIREELRLEKALLKERKAQFRAATRSQNIKNKTTFSDRIGKSTSEGLLNGIGKVGGLVGGIASISSLNSLMKENAKINQSLTTAFGVTGDALDTMTSKVKTLATTFDEDYQSIIQSANTLSKEMGISGEKALELIQNGFKKGANNSGEFLDILKEYPSQMERAGINAEEFISIITQQVKSGVYSDKGIDAIKEGGELLLENNTQTQKAISMLPKQTQENVKLALAQGKTFDAMKLISGELKDMNATDRFTITKAVFGTPGLDAGDKLIDSLATTETSLGNIKTTMSEFQTETMNMTTAWNDFVTSIVSSDGRISGVFSTIMSGVSDVLSALSQWNKYGEILGAGFSENQKKKTVQFASRYTKYLNQNQGLLNKNSTVAERRKVQLERLSVATSKIGSAQNRVNIAKSNINGSEQNATVLAAAEVQLAAWKMAKTTVENDLKKLEKSNKTIIKNNTKGNNGSKGTKTTKQVQRDLTNISASRAVKSLTINIDSLVKDGINIETTNMTESAAKLEIMMKQMLINVVNQSGNQILGK